MQPEAIGIDAAIHSHGERLSKSDLELGLNYPLFEWAPRTHRPFSSYFEIIDVRFRSWLWNYVPPHPSFSLAWIFLLILCPIMLIRFLRSRGISEAAAYCAASLFLASPGTLSISAMFFRPAKPMTNFAILLSLSLAGEYEEEIRNSTRAYLGLLVLMFFSFFWDETALIIYPAFAVFFYELVLKSWPRLIAFALLPVFAFLTFFRLLPALSVAAGFERPDSASFWPLARVIQHYSFPADVPVTFQRLLMDSLGMTNPYLIPSTFGKLLVIGAIIASAVLFLFFLKSFVNKGLKLNFALRSLVCLIGAGLMSALLSGGNQQAGWGLFWYGTYWTVFFSIAAAVALSELSSPQSWRAIATSALIVAALLYIFPYTNRIYKNAHYGRYRELPETLLRMFDNSLNRFTEPDSTPPEIYSKTKEIWKAYRSGVPCGTALEDLKYMCFELRKF